MLSPKEFDVFTDHGTVSFEFYASTKATHKVKNSVGLSYNGDFVGLRKALEVLNLCNVIQGSYDINSDWTFWKDAFMSAVSDFIPTKKTKEKNTPPWITSKIIHALRKKETSRSKLKKSATDHQQQKYRELRAKARLLYVRAVRLNLARSTQSSRGSLHAFGPFSSSRIEYGPSLKR